MPRRRHSLPARALLLAASLSASLFATGPAAAATGADPNARMVEGTLALGAGENFDTEEITPSAFLVNGRQVQEVTLPPGLDTTALAGRHVKGQGRQDGDRVVLRSLVHAAEVESASTGGETVAADLSSGTTLATSSASSTLVAEGRVARVAIINFNFSNDRRVPYSNAAVAATAFGTGRSLAGFYAEMTRGQLTVSGSVFGWYTIRASNAGCQMSTWASQARAAATKNGVDLSQFGYLVYSFPRVSGCSFGGHAIVGGGHSWLNGYGTSVYVLSHEIGHNLGLWHARSKRCLNSSGARVTLSGRCTTYEYGDTFDMMGSTARQLNGAHRRGIGAIPSTAVKVVTSTMTLTLARAGGGTGIRLIRIPRSSAPGQYFDLEFRPNAGMFDQLGSASTNRGVLVHLDTTYTAPTDLLDMTPATASFSDAALVSGRAWKHSIDRVTIGVGAVTTSGIKVTITFGPDVTAPSAPSGFTATPGSNSVALTWQPAWDNVAVTSYRLYRNGTAIATLAAGTRSYEDRNLRPETRYDYSLRAYDAAGHVGPFATVGTTTLPPDTNPPSAPWWLRATAGADTVSLAWGSASDAEGALRAYQVRRDGIVVQRLDPATRWWTDTQLVAGTYTYTVSAVDIAGNVGPAATRTVTIQGPDSTAPSSPGWLSVDTTESSATLHWTAATDDVGVDDYRIWRDGELVATVGSRTRSWYDGGLAPGTYEYAVAAVDDAGNQGPARTVTAIVRPPDVTAPSAPTGLRLDEERRRSVRITWDEAQDDVGVVLYRVYRDGRLVDETSWTIFWDRPGDGTWIYTVVAVDAAGNESPPSDPLEVHVGR